ncbi:replication initiator protein [Blackfly microvirus SF02]|uniref:Replication initiator protein n=1 Tax=Blackfly microvirus SF02 TaxID=2576452 RepID=A0A4P8PQ39_9VIRU|nr:replication initiator protein [Blackfly microvirus SF02]
MPCYHPMRARQATPGAQPTILKKTDLTSPWNIKLPCAKCWGCRLERSRQTAVRLMHEAQLHKKKCFITPTYDDEHLPIIGETSSQSLTVSPSSRLGLPHRLDNAHTRKAHAHEDQTRVATLQPRHLQLFTKRLTEDVRRKTGLQKNALRYYACGEYGDLTNRPHYHLAVFGEDFSDDRVEWKRSNGNQLWRSSRLTKLWSMGDIDIGELTFESAAYIARYLMKKVNGHKAHEHYKRTDENGNDFWIEPEFCRMSRRPGIGNLWFQEYARDVFPQDYVIINGKKSKPPRYYDKLLQALEPLEAEAIKLQRKEDAKLKEDDDSYIRRRAKEKVAIAASMQHKRNLE